MLRFAILILLVAVVIYVVTRLLSSRGSGPGGPGGPGGPAGPTSRRRTPPPRPVGPDDDEEFLRDIDRKRRSEGS